jgi:hypothetical protein
VTLPPWLRELLLFAALVALVLVLHIWIPDAGTRCIVAAAIWLAIETRILRFATGSQSALLEDERRLNRTPFLVLGLAKEQVNSSDEYTIKVTNRSLCPAMNLGGFVYFANSRNFALSDKRMLYLGASGHLPRMVR